MKFSQQECTVSIFYIHTYTNQPLLDENFLFQPIWTKTPQSMWQRESPQYLNAKGGNSYLNGNLDTSQSLFKARMYFLQCTVGCFFWPGIDIHMSGSARENWRGIREDIRSPWSRVFKGREATFWRVFRYGGLRCWQTVVGNFWSILNGKENEWMCYVYRTLVVSI